MMALCLTKMTLVAVKATNQRKEQSIQEAVVQPDEKMSRIPTISSDGERKEKTDLEVIKRVESIELSDT